MKCFIKVTAFLLVLLFFLSTSYAHFNPTDPIEHRDLYEETSCIEIIPEEHSVVDWTDGNIITRYSVPMTFRDSNVGRGMMNLSEQLKKKIILFSINACSRIIISSSMRLQDYFDQDETIKHKMLSKLYQSSLQDAVLQGSSLFGSIITPIFGKKGISDLFYQYINPKKMTQFLEKESTTSFTYDTLIIDTVMFPQYNPSIAPKILNQRGDLVHSIDTVDPDVLQKRGPVIYVSSISQALHKAVDGKKIAYILPHSITGLLSSDIVLFDEDVKRIYGQERTIDCIFEGRVIIIKPKNI